MVDPALPADQRLTEGIQRFLFGDGPLQILAVSGMFFASILCFTFASIHSWAVLTGRQSNIRVARLSTGAAGLTVFVFGIIYFVLA